MLRRALVATIVVAVFGTGSALADPTPFPSFPAATATPQLGMPQIEASVGPSLPGPMAAYAWFPGRWACRTGTAANPNREPVAGKLYVVADAAHDAIKEFFSTTMQDGKPYRSDDVLTYDEAKRAFVRRSVDQNGAQVALIARGPYASSMAYGGYLGLQNRKIYRMKATISIDPDQTQMTTETAFYQAPSKTWAVQSTTVCTKIVL